MPWKSFNNLFDTVLKDLACRYAKPQMLTETGSAGNATEKASMDPGCICPNAAVSFLARSDLV